MINQFGTYYPNYGMNQQTQDERIWVQNETSAEAYLVAPNGFVRLWDANKPVFYEKRADASGRPLPMDVFEYVRKSPRFGALGEDMDKSVRDEIKEQIDALTQRIEALESVKKGGKVNAKSNTDDTTV